MHLDINENAKSYALLKDIYNYKNSKIFDKNIGNVNKFKMEYAQFSNDLFFDLCINFGGAVIDNWIRLYGCGQLDMVEKNKKYNLNKRVDIIFAEDVLGGLFGIKDKLVYYYAPDQLKWENLQIYYAYFADWLLNHSDAVAKFYGDYRWNGWKEDLENFNISDGISFYPFLFTKEFNISTASKKKVPFDEIVLKNFEFEENFNKFNL